MRRFRVYGIVPADGDKQYVNAAKSGNLFAAQLVAEVTEVDKADALRLDKRDGIFPAERAVLFVVKGREARYGEGGL